MKIRSLHNKILFFLFTLSISAFAKETRNRIVIIDSGISPMFNKQYLCTDGNKDFTLFRKNSRYLSTPLQDRHGHGTNIAAIISKAINVKKQCITVLKFWNPDMSANEAMDNFIAALSYIQNELKNVKYLNLSVDGKGWSNKENDLLLALANKGVKISVAAGNDGRDLSEMCVVYPACYDIRKNFYVIGNINNPTSNYNGPVSFKENGNNVCGGGYCFTGTSQAAALFTLRLLTKENSNDKTLSCAINLSTDRTICF